MPSANAEKMRELVARCRLAAADLEDCGFHAEHDRLLTIAAALPAGAVRTAQYGTDPMLGNVGDAFGSPQAPYQTGELADVGSPENPRPTDDDIMSRQPTPGSRLDPNRGTPEDGMRKWVVEISDIPAKDENDLRSQVEPFVNELGALLSDYKEEAPRTRQRAGGGGGG